VRGTRLRALGFTALVAVLTALVAQEATGGSTATTVRVTEKEWSLKPAPASVKPGPVTFVLKNAGKLAHELVVLKTKIAPGKLPTKGTKAREPGKVGKISSVKPGAQKRVTLNLKAGKYVLICNVPAHYKSGQFGAFRVG
jgi:uncharacterized cupredoxin-like copper-binding protein